MNREPIRIALVRLTALGDIINGTIVLQLIKKHYPNAQIEWFCEAAFAPVLEGHPDLLKVHAVPIKRIKKEKSLALLKATVSALKASGPFDKIIDMQGLIKSAVVARLIGKNIHGFDKASARESLASRFYATHSHIPYEENVIRRNIDVVAQALGFKVSDGEILAKQPCFASREKPAFLASGTKNIAFVIGASWPSKEYPKERFSELALDLKEARCILIWGSEREREYANFIAKNAPNAVVAPKLSLAELRAVIEHCDLTIGNDTGPTHLAWAMNRPSITLFGPTNTRMIYETPINLACESDSKVDINKIDKNDFSIRTIPVEVIADKAKGLLAAE
ncbi:lipopolysaccharide heptosyltransferase I [Sulfurimonas sp. HSL3-7]|uniref:lipopolysaccharide heptosyltransferase I n=1 Tax=Sulfonitrofixus jiaomeiensis TaxID=3131938 RepID=UPI0031F7D664